MADTLTYTQHTVAWPRLPQDRSVQDEINVSLATDGDDGTSSTTESEWRRSETDSPVSSTLACSR